MSEPIFSEWRLSLLEKRFIDKDIPLHPSDNTSKRITDLVLDLTVLPLEQSTTYLMDMTDPNRSDDPIFKAAAQICLEVLVAEQQIESY